MLASLALTVVGCGEGPLVREVAVRVQLTPAADTVTVGEISQRLSATVFNVRDEPILDPDLRWRSDEALVAEVDSLTGAVTGVSEGVAAITASAGLVSDTAAVSVLAPLALDLPLDTIVLAPGDTFTIPVSVFARGGASPPSVTFSGGTAAIATVDASGLVTAQGPGVVRFRATAGSVAVDGGVQVRVVQDTTDGTLYLGLRGGIDRRVRLASRLFNHPTDDSRSVVALSAETLIGRFAFLLLDSLSAPRTSTIGTLTASDIARGADPVCRPPGSWVFYREETGLQTGPITSLSVAGGSVSITSVIPIPNGRAVSGRFEVTLQRLDDETATGRVTARGTFAVPLIDLGTCPK